MASPEEAIEAITNSIESIDQDLVADALAGQVAAKATIEAWAVEMEAAIQVAVGLLESLETDAEAMIDSLNTLVDTIQAILLAIGIAYLLKRMKKRRRGGALSVFVTRDEFEDALGDRVKPIPSRPDADKEQQAAYLALRIVWTTHFLETLLQGIKLQLGSKGGVDLIWRAHLDSKTCTICRFMDGKKADGGDFLPIIVKAFPAYVPYTSTMIYPHAHPRCRCYAEVA